MLRLGAFVQHSAVAALGLATKKRDGRYEKIHLSVYLFVRPPIAVNMKVTATVSSAPERKCTVAL